MGISVKEKHNFDSDAIVILLLLKVEFKDASYQNHVEKLIQVINIHFLEVLQS